MHHRGRSGGLTESAEACGRTHLGGDQVSHLVDVRGVHGGQLLHRRDPLGVAQPRPRALVECHPGDPDRCVDVLRRGGGRVRDDLLGMRRDDVDPAVERIIGKATARVWALTGRK